jgi:hypothetical protein
VDPAEGLPGGHGTAGSRLGALRQPVKASGQLAHKLLRLLRLARQPRQALHVPQGDEMVHDARIVLRGVHAAPLRDGGEVVEEPVVRAVVHEVRRHGDLLLHHLLERQHRAARVQLEQLAHNPTVRNLMPLLVRRNNPADRRQLVLAQPLRMARRVAVGDERRPLLKRRVDKAIVRVPVDVRLLSQNQVTTQHTESWILR